MSDRPSVVREIGRKAASKLRARTQRRRGVWFGLGMFGLVGWSVAVPALVGIAVGRWVDARWPGTVSWTLSLMVVGIVIGCLNAWRWMSKEGRHEQP